jgi:predicted PurR-regulated permease PerM
VPDQHPPAAHEADLPAAPPVQTPPLSDTRHDAVEAVTWPVRVAAAWSWRVIVIGGAAYLAVRLLGRVGIVVFSFIIALFLTAMLHPLEVRFRRLPGRKSLSALLALLIGLLIVGGLGTFVAWQISSHDQQLADQATKVVNNVKHWLETGPLHIKSSDLDKVSGNLVDTIKKHGTDILSGAIDTVKAVSEGLAALLLVLLTTFYLLRDGELVWRWVVHLFPKRAHARLDFAGRAGWGTFGGYMRGQFLIALFHGVTTTVLLFILRVPLAAALGVLIFIGSFIPLLGLTVTGALAVAIAILEHGLTAGIIVAVAIIVLVQVESHVLQPIIMSRSVHVHPLAVVLAVIAGTALKGIPGALIAVPLVAFLNTSIKALNSGPTDAPRDVREAAVDPPVTLVKPGDTESADARRD